MLLTRPFEDQVDSTVKSKLEFLTGMGEKRSCKFTLEECLFPETRMGIGKK